MIAWVSSRGVYVERADGSGRRRLSLTVDGISCSGSCLPGEFAWSPDGQRLAVAATNATPRDSRKWKSGLMTSSVKTGRSTEIAPVRVGGPYVVFAWSPDGRLIAYSRFTQTGVQLAVANADGTQPRTLFTAGRYTAQGFPGPALDDISAAWSPDGRSLAFATTNQNPRDPRLAIIDIATGNVNAISGSLDNEVPFVSDELPVWSPDSQRLAVTASDQTVGTLPVVGGDVQSLAVVGRPVTWTQSAGLIILGGTLANEGFHAVYASPDGHSPAQLLFRTPSNVTIVSIDPS
jgi:dipeptidyl aminopeptidase/acylaminoacyl peptidase